jgi:hypothetical protein
MKSIQMVRIKQILFLFSLFLITTVFSNCKNSKKITIAETKIMLNLDSVIVISCENEDSREQLMPILYYYFTFTNLYLDSTIIFQIEKFKNFKITKDSLVVYYNGRSLKLYTSFRSNIFIVNHSSTYKFTLSPDPGDVLESLSNEQNIIIQGKLTEYVRDAEMVLYLSQNSNINSTRIKVLKNPDFKLKTKHSDDPWF